MRHRKNLHFIFCCLVVGIGCASSVGYFLRSDLLRKIGFVSGASPAPFVFNQFRGFEYWATKGTLELVFAEGQRKTIPTDYDFYKTIGQSHTLRMAYLIPSALSPRLTPNQGCTPLYYGFCKTKLLNQRFGISDTVQEFYIHLHSQTAGQEMTMTRHCRCE